MAAADRARRRALPAAASALAALLLVWAGIQDPNVDDWFMLATGGWVAAHGIPDANPFAPAGSDYPIVVQQWAYCVLLHLFHSAGGWRAVGAMNAMFSALMLCSLSFSLRSFGLPRDARLMVAAPFMLGALFESAVRPHSLDMAVWLYLVGAMERHRAGGDRRFALAAPAVVAAHANLHLASVPIDVLVVAARALPVVSREGGAWSAEWRPKAPAACALACLAAGCLTPYGPAGLLLPFWGSVGASYGGVVAECLPIWAGSAACAVIAALCTAVMAAGLAARHPARADLAAASLLAVSLAATCLRVRFYPLLVVSWVPALASSHPGPAARPPAWGELCGYASAGMAVTFVVTLSAVLLAPPEALSSDGGRPARVGDLAAAAGGIAEMGAAPGDAVLTTPLTGGFLECAGYRITMDSCTERWSQPMPGGGLNRDLFDFYDSVNRREGAAERYASRWAGEVGWAVVGQDALSGTAEFPGARLPAEGTLVGYLEGSPAWERVHGEWEAGYPERPPVYVYRKVL